MYEITDENTREEENWERYHWLAFAALIFLAAIIAVAVNVTVWMWYYKVLFSIGAVVYFVGYCKCYPVFYESMMKGHCMRHSANYRMTDGHLLAFLYSFFWPLLWLGRTIIRPFKKRRAMA